MAYYSHPLFTPATGSRHPAYHFGPTGASPSHQQPFHHQSYSASSLDEEERLAYAHLAAIQRRREAEAASIQREAAARYQAQQQREDAIARQLEAERRREAAIRHAMAVEERKRQIAIAIEERKRHVAAQIAKHKEEQALRAAAVAHARQQQIEEHRRRYARAVEQARAEKEQRYVEHVLAKRNACARRCAAKRQEQAEVATEEKEIDGLEALNSLFGSLFGVTFANDNAGEKKEETPAAPPAATRCNPVKSSETTTATPTPEFTKPETDTKQADSAFPEAINDLVSHFLGLRVEPTGDSSTPSASSNKVPEGLNELLGQFGLVFEPTGVEEKAQDEAVVAKQEEVADPEVPLPTSLPAPAVSPTSASTPAPAAAASSSSSSRTADSVKNDTPLTAFLDSAAHLPPFVRDILGNVELAFKEERHRQKEQSQPAAESPKVEGKGKGVAEGEKKASPSTVSGPASAPSPAPASESVDSQDKAHSSSTSSIAQLDAIASELDLATASFTFPSTLSFSATSASPSLLFNRTNSPYHAQTNKLLQLLLSADGVSTNGDKSVRQRRKEVVRQVEAEIERLESKRDEMWHEVQEKRERGEEVEGDVEDERSWSGSETASVASKSRAASVVDESEERETLDEVQGFEVPKEVEHVENVKASDSQHTPASALVEESKSFADVAKAAPISTEAGSVDVEEVRGKQDGEQKSKVEEAKDEGFELL